MNRNLYLRKIRNLRDQVDMLLMESEQEATLKDVSRNVLDSVSLGVFNNFFKSDFVAHSPEINRLQKR